MTHKLANNDLMNNAASESEQEHHSEKKEARETGMQNQEELTRSSILQPLSINVPHILHLTLVIRQDLQYNPSQLVC